MSSRTNAPKQSKGEFLALMAAAMATTAIAIDVMLPAFADVRGAFGMEDNSASTGLIVSVFIASMRFEAISYLDKNELSKTKLLKPSTLKHAKKAILNFFSLSGPSPQGFDLKIESKSTHKSFIWL